MDKPFFRDKEIEMLKKLIQDNDIIFVRGFSGVGKTTIIKYIIKNSEYEGHDFHFRIPILEPYSIISDLENAKTISIQNSKKFYFKILKKAAGIAVHWKAKFKFDSKNLTKHKIEAEIYEGGLLAAYNDSRIEFEFVKNKLNSDNASYYFRRFFLTTKRNFTFFIFENFELFPDKDLQFLYEFLMKRSKKVKIIFEIGGLENHRLVENKLEIFKTFLNNAKISFSELKIEAFSKKTTKDYIQEMLMCGRLEKSSEYEINHGLPLLIELYGNPSFGRDDFDNAAEKIQGNEYIDLFCFLTIIYGFGLSEDSICSYAHKILGINPNFKNFKKTALVKNIGNELTLSHPLIYKVIIDENSTELKCVLNKFLEHEEVKYSDLYFFVKIRFFERYGLDFDTKEAELFLDCLSNLVSDYKLRKVILLLQNKDSYFPYLSEAQKNVINLINLQVNLYDFTYMDTKFFEGFEGRFGIVAKLLELQYLDHQNNFISVEYKISNFQAALLDNKGTKNNLSPELVQYINIILNGINVSVKRALSQYDEAKDSWQMAVDAIQKSGDVYKNIKDYLYNLYPFYNGIKETYSEHKDPNRESELFFNYRSIKNPYIKAKREHNIYTVDLYYEYHKFDKKNKLILEEKFYNVIKELERYSPLETSYTRNNLLVLYVLNGSKGADRIIESLEHYYFETYDEISFYNNALVYYIIKQNHKKIHQYYKKAKALNFSDASFSSKIHFNMALYYKTQGQLDKMGDCFKRMTIGEDYDNGLIERKKEFIKNNNINTTTYDYQINESDVRERYIFWVQIIHFWDFDVPILNKQVLSELLHQEM